MADRLDMSTSGYQRIERDDVAVSLERLEEIAKIFDMKPEDVLSFDEKYVFNNYNGSSYINHNSGESHFHFPEEMKKLYEDNIRLLTEQVKMQQKMIEMLERGRD